MSSRGHTHFSTRRDGFFSLNLKIYSLQALQKVYNSLGSFKRYLATKQRILPIVDHVECSGGRNVTFSGFPFGVSWGWQYDCSRVISCQLEMSCLEMVWCEVVGPAICAVQNESITFCVLCQGCPVGFDTWTACWYSLDYCSHMKLNMSSARSVSRWWTEFCTWQSICCGQVFAWDVQYCKVKPHEMLAKCNTLDRKP